jgi:hypothetical protein
MRMLPGESTWLAVFDRGTAAAARHRDPPITFRSRSSGWALQLELGDDPEGPVIAERDETAVILDGFLLDRGPLTSVIGSRPAGNTEGDAALILAAYLELGERVLPLLRGSFGLVIWDGQRDRILCARDLTGSHPLFFSRAGDRILVAASHGALLEAGGVPADVDRLAIARWVLSRPVRSRTTFYARIERLPLGYALLAAPDGVAVRRYWHPADTGPSEEPTPGQAVDQFEELLDQAVSRCASLGRLGVFLSGGADSAAVAASAAVVSRARSLPDPIALSVVYPGRGDEEVTQRSVGTALGMPHHIFPVLDTAGREGLLMAALRLTARSWTPCINPWAPAFVHLAREGASLGCRAILSGEGGNSWFEAELFEAADLVRRLKLVELRRLWLARRQVRTSTAYRARTFLWRYGARPLVHDFVFGILSRVAEEAPCAVRRRRFLSSLPSGWALPDGGLRSALVEELLEGVATGRSGSYRAAADENKLEGTYYVLWAEQLFLALREFNAHYVNPVLDPDLVQFLYGLPNALLNLRGQGKGLPRETVRRRAGEEPVALIGIAWLDDFLASLVRDGVPAALETFGGLRCLSELGIIDEREFAQELRGSGLGRKMSYYQAWQTLACEAWLRARE